MPVADDPITTIAAGLTSILGPLKNLATMVAVIAIIACGLVWLLNPDPKGAASAKTGLITAVAALCLIYAAPAIIKLVVSALGGDTSIFSTFG